jgi:acetyl-CoA acetyltransferase family protein
MARSFGKKMAAHSQFKMKYLKPVIAMELGLTDPVSGLIMGKTAEHIAKDFGISREEQDAFALDSHLKAVAAQEKLKEEITPAYVPPKYKKVVDFDTGPRKGQSIEALGKLRPFFDRKHGSVTVGNACPITDGATVLMMMSEDKAKAEGYPILGRIRSFGFAGCEPSRMGMGPVFSTPKALKSAGCTMNDMDLVEINEAFAAQVIGCLKGVESKKFAQDHLGQDEAVGAVDPSILNVNGGAIALGHPVGTTGSRLILTILKELKRRDKNLGLATLCIGGGQGAACVVERVA